MIQFYPDRGSTQSTKIFNYAEIIWNFWKKNDRQRYEFKHNLKSCKISVNDLLSSHLFERGGKDLDYLRNFNILDTIGYIGKSYPTKIGYIFALSKGYLRGEILIGDIIDICLWYVLMIRYPYT